MSVTRLYWCDFCGARVDPTERVILDVFDAHPGCAEAWHEGVRAALGCSRAEGDHT